MKTALIFCFYIIFISYSSLSFSFNNEEVEKYLDDMLSYQLDFKKQEKKLSDVIIDISDQLAKDNENPYLWYLKGRSSFSAIYAFDKTNERYDKYKELISIEFEKALFLNKDSII